MKAAPSTDDDLGSSLTPEQLNYVQSGILAHGINFAGAYAKNNTHLAVMYFRSTGVGPFTQWQPVGNRKDWRTNWEQYMSVADDAVELVAKEYQ